MNEKFTPAPWFVYGHGVKDKATEKFVAYAEFDPNGATEGYANAALIAAAPEMYAMLEQVAELVNTDGMSAIQWIMDNTNDVSDLLAKARGEV